MKHSYRPESTRRIREPARSKASRARDRRLEALRKALPAAEPTPPPLPPKGIGAPNVQLPF